jgi:glucosamine-6-phosphate deaminase
VTEAVVGPEVVAASGAHEIGQHAADVVAAFVRAEPHGVLGVATGSSPEPLYAELVLRRQDGLRTCGLTLVALDEYVGLEADHPESYRTFVRDRIARPLGVDDDRVVVPDGSCPDPVDATLAADAHERRIVELGGVGLQIVGIGANGHLGFNEPGSPFDGRSRVVELADRTRLDNARYFGGDARAVPSHAITQGLGTIMAARQVLLVARGRAKAAALAAALQGPVTESVPASLLRRHPRVTIVADREALGAV